jgi:hypothetical protein
LLAVLAVNVLARILHYVHNILFFHGYLEPEWISPQCIDAFWFVVTPFAALGYLLYRKGKRLRACLTLYLYSGMSLLVLCHYLYAPIRDVSDEINSLILLEATSAIILVGFATWLHLNDRDAQRLA